MQGTFDLHTCPLDASPAPAPQARCGEAALGLSSPTKHDAKASHKKPLLASAHSLVIYTDSQYAEVKSKLPPGSRPVTRGDRQAITAFTGKSRLALRRVFNKLRSEHRNRCLFVTLTYHANMLDGRQAKADLDAFDKALTRAFPTSGYIWKMEVQQRGSIHYHLLIFGVRFIHHDWIAETWARIVAHGGPIDEDQRKAGTNIQMAEKGAARAYLEKYVAKVLTLGDGPVIENPGRYWGVRRMEQFQGEKIEVPLPSRRSAIEACRTLDKLRRAQIVAAWRERGEWNRSIGRAIETIRGMIRSANSICEGKLSALLHRLQCSRRPDDQFSEIGYEHCWMLRWARKRKQKCAVQRSVWQVTMTDRTAAQLLSIALA